MGSGVEERGGAVVKPERRGPMESPTSIGFDRGRRPGVPMAAEPEESEGVAGRPLARQEREPGRRLHRAELDAPTPVFGTAQPPRGLPGLVRGAAYRIPEHRARHWMLLLLADRLDTARDRLGGTLARPLEGLGADDAAARVRERPWLALGVAAAAVWAAKRLAR